eukprot:265729-Ditylum_brightwellii.AAC.1
MNLNSNDDIGHIMTKKVETHTRICILNPNRVSMNSNCEQHQETCDAMSEHNIGYFGCPEINLDTAQQSSAGYPLHI